LLGFGIEFAHSNVEVKQDEIITFPCINGSDVIDETRVGRKVGEVGSFKSSPFFASLGEKVLPLYDGYDLFLSLCIFYRKRDCHFVVGSHRWTSGRFRFSEIKESRNERRCIAPIWKNHETRGTSERFWKLFFRDRAISYRSFFS